MEKSRVFVTYEEPLAGGKFTYNQMEEIYRDMADKEEYPDFQTWLHDMLKSGVFEEEIKKVFPIITEEVQENFEKDNIGKSVEDLPMICGYYGRACRQMDKTEGANRANCMHCPLAQYAKEQENY